MTFNHIVLEVSNYVATLTLNRPEVLNALNRSMVDEIDAAADIIARNRDIRVVLLTGAGKHFAAGADIKDMAQMVPDEARAFAFGSTFNKLENLPQPVIAAVKGYALGAGFEMALTADIRLAGSSARFGLPEINLGIMPGAGGTQRLPRLIGCSQAKELIFLGHNIDAPTALELGLVNRVVADEELLDEAFKMAEKMSAKPPIALKMAKRTINTGLNLDIKSGTELEAISWSDLFATEDQKEGMKAFLEKRKPKFTGR
ncbi:MAG TPA: enoyl-CoA hydratase-related protein [Syntrophomonadaceae bacterium]|nr:enoyl-CoA hydratase-related protein [Syntrophomonadaceae bacterium]HPU49880.1 enoyl-CoA hydratase-related protein [Syntrophomonadaceae bacterium]